MSAPQNQTLLDLPKIIAVGIASPAATLLTSRFGVAGTLLGLALSAVFVTVVVDVLKVYLARVPGAVTTIPGGLRKKSSLRNVLERMKRPFSKVGSLSRAQRRSFLIGSLGAAGISCVVGLILITGVELSVGKSLSCWVWDECSAEEESSAADGSGRTAQASTLPSILGGGQSASSSTTPPGEVVNPQNPQQQPQGGGGSSSSSSSSSSSGAPQEAPWQASPEEVPGSDTPQPSSSAQPGQRQGPSGSAGGDHQQEVPSSRSNPADQQQPSSADDSQGSGG